MFTKPIASNEKTIEYSYKKRISSVFRPIVLFVLFDFIALSLNYIISYKLDENTVVVNLAGRQRMLTQRMTKALVSLVWEGSRTKADALGELQDTIALFDSTLEGLWNGGITLDGGGNEIRLQPVTSKQARLDLGAALQIWTQVKKKMSPFYPTDNRSASATDIEAAVDSLSQNNLKLLQLMNKITLTIENDTTRETGYLRFFQTLILILALINFFIIYKRLLRIIRQSQQNYMALTNIFNSMETGVILYDLQGRIYSFNKAAIALFGYSDISLNDKNINDLISDINYEHIGLKHNGQTFKAAITHQQLFQDGSPINICTIIDVTSQKEKEEQLTWLAFHDPLTKLPNRLLFEERLKHDLLHAKRNSTMMAVLFLDLDGFKEINDTFGHEIGDQLLKSVAQRLSQSCREDDTVARLGGDEFTMILTSVHSAASVKRNVKYLLQSIHKHFTINNRQIQIGVSIGISFYPTDHKDPAMLLKCADNAMYQAKKNGKNSYCFSSDLTS